MQHEKPSGGYYKVNIMVGKNNLPYIVFAHSDREAARLVREETGYMALGEEVEGPYSRQGLFVAVSNADGNKSKGATSKA